MIFTSFTVAALIASASAGSPSHSGLRSAKTAQEPAKQLSLATQIFKNATAVSRRKADQRDLIFSCNDDYTYSGLGDDSPLFRIGSINLQDLLQDTIDDATADVTPEGYNVLPPRTVCAGEEDLSELGKEFAVEACESLDFLSETDVFAFGVQDYQGRSLCAAINPSTKTFAVAQSNILPNAKIGILEISLDAIGISTTKRLAAETLNKMWDNTGSPEQITVPGHVVIRGTGSLGFRVSDKVKATVDIDTTVLVDADYRNDGLGAILADDSDPVDFAVLVSGSASPALEVTSLNENGELENVEIDLSSLITGDVDVYTVVNGADTAVQIAGSVNLKLQGICDAAPQAGMLCDIFDGDSGVSGAVRTYGNKDGFGMQFAVEGNIGLASDFVEDVIGWPEDGHEFDVTFSLGFRGDALYVCADANGNEWCWNRCSSHSQCASDEFCHAFGMCMKDRGLGGACLDDKVCESGHCVRGFCSECPTLDESIGCASNEFCGQGFNLGYRCEEKRDVGGTCLKDNVCKSGHCIGGFCSECPILDSSQGCASDEFCAQQFSAGLKCEKKRDVGGACLQDNVCESGFCVGGFCSECPTIDSSTGCGSNQFCTQGLSIGYKCVNKRSRGGTCSSNNACASGYCVAGFCSDCPKIDSSTGCSSSQFCTQGFSAGYFCTSKKGRGGTCSSNNACASGKCDAGFCVDCYRSGSGCSSSQYCDLGRCKTKIDNNSICVENRVCKSGNCGGKFPYPYPVCK